MENYVAYKKKWRKSLNTDIEKSLTYINRKKETVELCV